MAVAAEPEQQLAWEARQRPRAGVAGIAAGVLTIVGYLWRGVAFRDSPGAGFLESLGRLGADGPIGSQPSARITAYEYLDGRTFTIIGSAVLICIAYFAIGWAVTFLAAATRARRPEFIRPGVYLPLVGAVLAGVSHGRRRGRDADRHLGLPRRPADGRRGARGGRRIAAPHRRDPQPARSAAARRRPDAGQPQRHARRPADPVPRLPRHHRRRPQRAAADADPRHSVVLAGRDRDALPRRRARRDPARVAHRQGRAVADEPAGRRRPPPGRREAPPHGSPSPSPRPSRSPSPCPPAARIRAPRSASASAGAKGCPAGHRSTRNGPLGGAP